MSRLVRSPFLLAVALIVAAALSACGASAAPTPEATATPLPTATPVPVEPITVDPLTDPDGFLTALPQSEVDCATGVAGSRERLVSLMTGEAVFAEDEGKALAGCISPDTAVRVVLGQLETEGITLSPETRQCISAKVSDGVSFEAMLGEQPAPEDLITIFQAVFCLNSAERAAVEAKVATETDSAFFLEGVKIDDLECFVNEVGPTRLAETFGAFTGEMTAEVSLDFFPEMVSCGLIEEEDLAETGLTLDQAECLFEKAGPTLSALLASQTGDMEGTADMEDLGAFFTAFAECGIDLEDLNFESMPFEDPFVDPSAEPGDPSGFQLTPEQIECLTTHGASIEAAAEAAAGDLTNIDLDLFAIIAGCGLVEDASTSSGTGGEGETGTGEGALELPFTLEQVQCLQTELGDEAIAGIASGELPPFEALAAMETCGIDLSTLFSASSS